MDFLPSGPTTTRTPALATAGQSARRTHAKTCFVILVTTQGPEGGPRSYSGRPVYSELLGSILFKMRDIARGGRFWRIGRACLRRCPHLPGPPLPAPSPPPGEEGAPDILTCKGSLSRREGGGWERVGVRAPPGTAGGVQNGPQCAP